MSDRLTIEILAACAELEAVNYRCSVERHEEMCQRRPPRWNPELLPSERRHSAELDGVAKTMRMIANSKRAQAALKAAWAGDAAEKAEWRR